MGTLARNGGTGSFGEGVVVNDGSKRERKSIAEANEAQRLRVRVATENAGWCRRWQKINAGRTAKVR